jgi:TRAP-type C4-dicarboxylate transport system substrate-binding protein
MRGKQARAMTISLHRSHRAHLIAAAGAALTLLAGCGSGASKSGGQPETAPDGTITLSFASGEPRPVDTTFTNLAEQLSRGHLRIRTVYYNAHSTSVDQSIASGLRSGKLDVGDVASRAWESLGVEAFRAYQEPFLVTSRELLDKAVTGTVASGLLGTLMAAKITGLAIVPRSIRYLYSTRPLTTPAQFQGAKIRINVSATTSEVLTALGATGVTDVATSQPAVQALRSGTLTAIEADPETAILNGYVQAAPYVLVNAPLFAKTTTFAVNSARLARLPAQAAGWLRQAARQAAASQAGDAEDRVAWASACGQGLKPLAITPGQFAALHAAEAATYADLAADQQTTLAVGRIGGLAVRGPRMDAWATCHGVGIGASPTKVMDGTYGVTISSAEVASGGGVTCGNDGMLTLTVHDGRSALVRPTLPTLPRRRPTPASCSAASSPGTVSGARWDTARPWRRLS